jgi:hypothetical protein
MTERFQRAEAEIVRLCATVNAIRVSPPPSKASIDSAIAADFPELFADFRG